ncbi:MAG: type IX secretion system plug protein [Flavisolibacter sp.]
MKRLAIIFYLVSSTIIVAAQGEQRDPNIKSIKLYNKGDQTSFPIIPVGSIDAMELHFDDLSNRMKNYSYTFQLCNVDWTPSMLHPFEYIKGFQNVRITNYRNSSIATTRYMHYQASLPDRNCYPSRSGNYLLKVFLDNDTSKLVFSRRMVVLDNKTAISGTTLQPFNSTLFRTAQKLTIVVQTDNRIQVMSPNDLKVVILQNNNWQTSSFVDRPTIFRGNYYEYSDEAFTALPGIKEFRWIDLRSLRLKSDRMEEIDTRKDTTEVLVKPDVNRSRQVYVYYRDLNGGYTIETMESINPFWQGDYAWVHFTYLPPSNQMFPGKDLYMFGEVTNYATDTMGKMNFNKETGAYEKTLFLKQGFYNYLYALKSPDGKGKLDFDLTEGNYFATQNSYTVLVYYRPFGARADELVGYAALHTAFER